MEHLYNPDLMSEQEIKQTFVARQGLVDELVALIEHQPTGAGVQHGVIIAPRGMGKTTVLMMVQFALQDRGLTAHWQPVRFPEESYGVYDLADFWLETLNQLSEEVGDPELRQRAEQLKAEYPASNDLQEAALATLKDWCRRAHKRLVLLVDNFDMILEQIGKEEDNARLRHLLMNDGTIMLLGGATTFFKEAHAYDQPLYNFFRIYDLPKLEFADMENLLRQRAMIDGTPNFERTLKANTSRLRVLQYFTGGNPRLVLMLYRVITRSAIVEVRQGLEKLLDEVTPYYKHKIESLPPQQRKILDHIARVSSETHEGQTPGQIAAATRLTPQVVSSQLKRLSELGYVRAANLRGRNSYYTLSEPLYAIWYQMRFGRDARRRMQWLVNFLKGYYDAEELGSESRRLTDRYHELLDSGLMNQAKEVLEHRRYLVEAMEESISRVKEFEQVIEGYLELKDTSTLKHEVLTPDILKKLSAETLETLFNEGCIDQDDIASINSSIVQTEEEFTAALGLSIAAIRGSDFTAALVHVKRALNYCSEHPFSWCLQGIILDAQENYEEALQSFDRALHLNSNDATWWALRGAVLRSLKRYAEAIDSFTHVLEMQPNDPNALLFNGILLTEIEQYKEALSYFDQAIKINPDDFSAWRFRGESLGRLDEHEEAIDSLDRALKINSGSFEAWFWRGLSLGSIGRAGEALESFDQALRINVNHYLAWRFRGLTLANLGKQQDALNSYDHALNLKSDDYETWHLRGRALGDLGRHDEALNNFTQALELIKLQGGDIQIRMSLHLMKFTIEIVQDKIALAQLDWNAALSIGKDSEDWQETVAYTLFGLAQAGYLRFVRDLIQKSELGEIFLPLARALDYLLTGDKTTIEKLSPEIRNVVDEIIEKLQPK